ncbi:MAG: hypothetical protein WD794_15125 [Mycobacteriales bacterium]
MSPDAQQTPVQHARTDGAAAPVQPAQDPAAPVAPVPAPGHADSSAGPGVRTAQGASPRDGVHAGEKSEGSDSSISSPGAWTALAAPGKPDGEVDTRP